MSQVSVLDKDFPFETPMYMAYQPSFNVAIFNAFIHLGAAGSVFLAAIPVSVSVLLTGCVLLHLLHTIRRYLHLVRCQTMLKLDRENQWQWIGPNDEIRGLDRLPGTFTHPCMVILRFKDECKRVYTYVLTTDNVDRQTLRRLRVRLRFS